ncbi:MAG TPA: hypothetical protein VIM86_16600 [Thermodesulfobacteriota bacterium]
MLVIGLLLVALLTGLAVPVSAAERADEERAPIGLALLLGYRELDADEWEHSAGHSLTVRPALAAGGAWTTATLVTEGGGVERRERDEAFGYWVSGTLYLGWRGPGVIVSEVRYLDAEVDLLGRRRQAGGVSFAFGLRFGAF